MKKLNKLVAILVAMAMVLSLGVVSAFAAGTEKYDLSKAKITKVWTIPEGVKDPNLSVTYTFAYNADKSSGVTDADAPTVGTVAEGATNGTATATYAGTEEETAAGKMVAVNTQLPTPTPITHAGVYAFDVTESASDITSTAVENEDVTKDGAKYRVRYYYQNVNKGTEENPNYQLELTGITVAKVTTTEETYTDENDEEKTRIVETEEKVDPTEPTENPEGITGDKVTGFRFNNTYSVTDGDDTQDPDGPVNLDNVALKVTKAVNPAEGQTAPDDSFPFTLTLTPAAGQTLDGVKAYIYKVSDGTRVGTTEYAPDQNGVITFNLKNGEALAILTLPAGTRYAASENLGSTAAYQVYTPSYKTSTEGTVDKYSGTKGAGETLATAGQSATVPTYLLKANEEDTVAYTNAYDNSINTPTGILISNLPYIALALVAIGGLVAYVVVRRRQDDEA